MKLLLPLALISTLASCASLKNNPRPSVELPCRGAPLTNQGLGYVGGGVGQTVTSSIDVTEDSIDYGGKVADRQARSYTNIGVNAVHRSDDMVYRETTRYTDYAMDTVDDGASFGAKTITRYPSVVTSIFQRGAGSTKKVYQSSVDAYGNAVDRVSWSFWDIFNPPEPKPYMVGSLNDVHGGHALPGSGWRCRLPHLPAEPAIAESEPALEPAKTSGKNPVTVSK